MSTTYNNISFNIQPGSVTLTLPDVRLNGQILQDNGPGVPDTTVIDFQNGTLSNPDGHGCSLWQLISAKAGDPAKLLEILNSVNPNQLAAAFAGIPQ